MSPPTVPSRGDIIWIDFDPQAGREQKNRRPALVLSPRAYNEKVRLCIACPITSRVKGYPFEVELPEGLDVHGVVLCDHVKSLDWEARHASIQDAVPRHVLTDVLAKLSVLLDPSD